MARCCSVRGLFWGLVAVWERFQVELHGQYSSQRLGDFRNYALHTSLSRAVAVILLAPLPCLAVVIAADTIPLASPTERGFAHNAGYVARSLCTAAIFTQSLMNECASYVPELALSFREQSIMALVVATLTAEGSFAVASAIAFPMPFGIALFSTPWLTLFMASIWIMRGRVIRENEHVRLELQNFAFIGGTQITMTMVYQVFYSTFSRMPASSQTEAVLVLPALKLLQKSVINRRVKHRDDMKPVVVTLNVELFHAMSVSCCMQRSTSIHTSAALTGVDFLHVCISLYDLHCMIGAIEALVRDSEHRLEIEEIVDVALRIDRRAPIIAQAQRHQPVVTKELTVAAQASRSASTWAISGAGTSARVHVHPAEAADASRGGDGDQNGNLTWAAPVIPQSPAPPTVQGRLRRVTTIRNLISADERKLLAAQNLLRAMFLTEFLLLIEFIEVVIPVAYYVYLAALFHLPNRVFYPHLVKMDEHGLRNTIQSVLVYAAMELGSFVALAWMIKRRLRLSAVHQLAFVLENQMPRVQSKLIMWFLFVLQSTLVHLGTQPVLPHASASKTV